MRIHTMCRVVAAVLTSLLLAACGGGEPDDDGQATSLPIDCNGPSAGCR